MIDAAVFQAGLSYFCRRSNKMLLYRGQFWVTTCRRDNMTYQNALDGLISSIPRMARLVSRLSVAHLALLTALCFIALGASNAAACERSVPWFNPGKTVTETMTAQSGVSCETDVTSSVSSWRSITIIVPPTNGTATVLGLHGWSYQSNPGFTGSDTFQVSVLRHPPAATIVVDVTVTK